MKNGERKQRGWQLALIALGVAGVLVAVGFAVLRPQQPGMENELAQLGRNLDDVRLTNQRGETVSWAQLKGRPRAVFFGFTHCPVICPVTVWEVNNALDIIGADASDVAVQFITVDPERDTPERLNAYLEGFGPRVTGFTADSAALQRLMDGFEVIAEREPLPNGSYTIDHTAAVFLIDRNGRVVDVVAYGTPPETLQERLRSLVTP